MRFLFGYVIFFLGGTLGFGETHQLKYQPAPPDNPLKGLVPYVEIDGWDRFPHSMEFHYFSLRDLMTGYETFDWSPIEKYLAITKKRGCQLVFRVMLEYPGRSSCVPDFLMDGGLKMINWKSADGENHTPDYEDPRLRRALTNFITELGNKYDGDPRIGYITAGLLGSWGEWHTYPKSELFASKETQRIVLDTYEKSFKKTPILLRYPAKEGHWDQASNNRRPFGYHDDSFAWATLDTGKKNDSWFFLPLLKEADALDKWKTQPIGGEIRPELWKTSFTDSHHPNHQDFGECVRRTHATWLMDTGLFASKYPLSRSRKENAIREVRKMGYEFYLSEIEKDGGNIRIKVENRGVAPFYHDWPAELFAGDTKIATFDLRGIPPGEPKIWTARHTGGTKGLKLRVPNPMPGGKPLRFANREQTGDWLVFP